MAQSMSEASEVVVRYPAPRWAPSWAVPEDVPVPETDTHDAAIEYLRALLSAWLERTGREAKLARNLGVRWVEEEPRAGFDPDLSVIEPAPPGDEPLSSVKLWLPGHAPPRLAIEVVSPSHPYKDYVDTPERCAACGVGELWIYDPMLAGPSSRGGPHLLQVWRRTGAGAFERTHAGEGPARSPLLEAWLQPHASRLPAGARLEVSDGPEGEGRWLTALEGSRDAERQAREAALQAREAALQAREAEQQARTVEQQARTAEQQARDAERQARTELKAERERRAELEQRLAELERSPRRGGG